MLIHFKGGAHVPKWVEVSRHRTHVRPTGHGKITYFVVLRCAICGKQGVRIRSM